MFHFIFFKLSADHGFYETIIAAVIDFMFFHWPPVVEGDIL